MSTGGDDRGNADDEFSLAPPTVGDEDGSSEFDKLGTDLRSRDEAPPATQAFTLRQLVVLILLLSVVLAISRLVDYQVAAFVVGVVLVALLVTSSRWSHAAIMQVGWWVLFGVYVLTSLLAIIAKG